jgi:hypothetical protein
VPSSNPAGDHRNERRPRLVALDDTGSASVEFLGAGILLLVPLIYLIVLLSTVQSAALAIEGAARQGARVFVQSSTAEAGQAGIARALELALADHGVAAETRVTVACTPISPECLAPRTSVTVEIQARVPLPLIPAFADVRAPALIPLQASATQQVSRFGPTR